MKDEKLKMVTTKDLSIKKKKSKILTTLDLPLILPVQESASFARR